MYFEEAFKALDCLTEETFSTRPEDLANLENVMDDDAIFDEVEIYDTSAVTEEDLQDSYIGKVILDCCTCRSLFYKDPVEVVFEEDAEFVNKDEECPICASVTGYKVVGEVAPFEKETTTQVDAVEETEEAIQEAFGRKNKEELYTVSVKEDNGKWTPVHSFETKEEAVKFRDEYQEEHPDLKYMVHTGAKFESINARKTEANTSLKEYYRGEDALDDVISWLQDHEQAWDDFTAHFSDVEDDDLTYEMVLDWISEHPTLYNDYLGFFESDDEELEESANSLTESIKDIAITTDDTHMEMTSDENGKVTVTSEPVTHKEEEEEEVIAPVSVETEMEIEENNEEESVADTSDETEELEADGIDEEQFDAIGESYLKRNFNNVESFKTRKVTEEDNRMFVEGVIKFKSGNCGRTTFVLEALAAKRDNSVMMKCYNKELHESLGDFKVRGRIQDSKIIAERFLRK